MPNLSKELIVDIYAFPIRRYVFKLLGICVKLIRKTWTRPYSIKVFEIDINQLFVQMRQDTPREMFSLLFSHLGPTNYNWQRKMNPTHGFYSITNTLGLLVGHSSWKSVVIVTVCIQCLTPTVVVYRQSFKLVLKFYIH